MVRRSKAGAREKERGGRSNHRRPRHRLSPPESAEKLAPLRLFALSQQTSANQPSEQLCRTHTHTRRHDVASTARSKRLSTQEKSSELDAPTDVSAASSLSSLRLLHTSPPSPQPWSGPCRAAQARASAALIAIAPRRAGAPRSLSKQSRVVSFLSLVPPLLLLSLSVRLSPPQLNRSTPPARTRASGPAGGGAGGRRAARATPSASHLRAINGAPQLPLVL